MEIKVTENEKKAITHALIIERDVVKRGNGDRYGLLSLTELEDLIRRLMSVGA